MSQSWDAYEKAADKGPMALAVKAVFGLVLLSCLIGGFGYVFGVFGEGAAVLREELGPRAVLRKYEWFKDASATLDKKRADIAVYATRAQALSDLYGDTPRREWARTDMEQSNLWSVEVAGVKASYNTLAAEYNANMAKVNYRFANVGDLPAGATEPLPREVKPYETR